MLAFIDFNNIQILPFTFSYNITQTKRKKITLVIISFKWIYDMKNDCSVFSF